MSTVESNIGDNGRAPPRALIKPLVILIIAVAVIMGGIFGWQLFIGKMTKKFMGGIATAPQTVSTVVAAATRWQARTDALGTVRAVRGADLAAQAAGLVDSLHIESGAEVPAGTVLLTLKPYDDPAKLEQLKAQAELAAITMKRDQEQLAAQAISQATVDSDMATLKSARAQVEAQRAVIAEKTVRAPFAGRLGIRQVDEGQYLPAGTTIVTLQALDPIYVDFYVPQQALGTLTVGQAVSATVDTYPGTTFAGKLLSINSKVDNASRNVQARASFANADRRLIPGMYANVAVDSGSATTEVTLPQAAITYNPYGDTVFVVERKGGAPADATPAAPENSAAPANPTAPTNSGAPAGAGAPGGKDGPKLTVAQRFVQVGDSRGDQVAIKSGVKAGEEVVSAGQLKLRSGTSIVINNQVVPSNDPTPTPPNE